MEINGSQLSFTPSVAYFSMEVGIDPQMPTYSGGLGILAGDTLRAAADSRIPLIGVTLLHRKGYFHQSLDSTGNQRENPAEWSPESYLLVKQPRISIVLEGRPVRIQAWQYPVKGVSGFVLPLYLLDTCLPENSTWDQSLTDYLYGGDARYRLCQEAVLGLGGIAMLRALGYTNIKTYHMNEGHSALLAISLLKEKTQHRSFVSATDQDIENIRQQCVFTTHTPVPAGHDVFSLDLTRAVLGEDMVSFLKKSQCCFEGALNMTYLALFFSHYINGVAMRHSEISRSMYPNYPINSITNGVHAATWTVKSFQDLFDKYFPEWRNDNRYLRYAISIPIHEIQQAHADAKRLLFENIKKRNGIELDPNIMTIGFARRATTYKRADLIFSDLERLKRIAYQVGPIQIIYSGKAHPRDEGGKVLIRKVFEAASSLSKLIPVVYLEEYEINLARQLIGGVDLWLNTPQKPMEASGTSGMKAALNGIPSLSVLDGWWIEGHLEGITGWSIGEEMEKESNSVSEATSLYNKLEFVILPLFYGRPLAFGSVMRNAISLNGSFFSSQRMIDQYARNAYFRYKE